MPSQTFFNLDKEKREKLILYAMEEFANNLYPNVSINKIIAKAQIPRGSFYMYFKDKDDLFSYLIDINTKKTNKLIKNIFIRNKGDLRNSFVDIYTCLEENLYKKEMIGIFKNIFIFRRIRDKKIELADHELFLVIEDYIDKNNLKETDNIEFVFMLLIQNLLISVADLIKNNNSKEIKRHYLKKLDILCYGIYKKEDYND